MKLFVLSLICLGLAFTNSIAQEIDQPEDREGRQFQEADAFQLADSDLDRLNLTAANTLEIQKSPIMTPPMGNYKDFKLKKIALPQGAIVRIYDMNTSTEIQSRKCEQKEYLIIKEKTNIRKDITQKD
ncbi:MAG: hypothetical protein WD398_05050 [Cyclobacteriaceae bacterium]